ncbi:MAG: lipopolysaccharide biosynthesis protein RfbH [Elusimicrobia bacterium]|nr:lipopolysaccharide biosynthesis protein RfbH [Elusimicrobiota bacterium]
MSTREEILSLVERYWKEEFARERIFAPGKTKIHYAGRVFDAQELKYLAEAGLDFWLTLGRFGHRFEEELKKFLGAPYALLVNSGSSASLVAMTSLTSSKLPRPLQKGDEVITPAVTFPTTLNPIIQNGLVPVFVDVELDTLNAGAKAIENALSKKTRALALPHTLGNALELDRIKQLTQKHGLYLLEDTCDALGGTYDGKPLGSFGDYSIISFYPAHQITMGEGGAVICHSEEMSKIAASVRDWGRDCWCMPGVSNTCGKRFDWQLGGLPHGYDHKYTYSHIGYNLKPTDMQAAVGLAQIEKLPAFIEARRANFHRIYEGLKDLGEYLILPRWDPKAKPCWFAFALTIRQESKIDAVRFSQYLEERLIETRRTFAGNIIKQPAYQSIERRIAGPLTNSDLVMSNTVFMGVYPGITPAMADYMIETVRAAIRSLAGVKV